MPMIKDKEQFGLCPYCAPYSHESLSFCPASLRIYCRSCGYAVLIEGLYKPSAVYLPKLDDTNADLELILEKQKAVIKEVDDNVKLLDNYYKGKR